MAVMRNHISTLYALVAAAIVLGVWGDIQMYRVAADESYLTNELGIVERQVAVDQASSTQEMLALQNSQIRAPNTGGAVSQTQDQQITSAVAKTAPAVVSIVISKAVPNLQVQYVNPFGDDPSFKDFGIQIPVYKQNGSSVQQVGAGSGFIVTSNGKILTNKHVVSDEKASYTALLSNGSQKSARVIYRDPSLDIALLQIDGSYASIAPLGDSAMLKLGQAVIAIGNALGEYSNSVSTGIISGLNRNVQAQDGEGSSETLSNVIQTDASINLGNSGGPLIDIGGKVIGINVATVVGSSNINFAIPIDAVKKSIADYIK